MKLSTLAVAATLGLAALGGRAQATTIEEPQAVIDITQVGGDVVATVSGPIDLTGLTLAGSGLITSPGFLWPADGEAVVGAEGASFDEYIGFSGPASFGAGSFASGSSGSGGPVGVDASGVLPTLFVPSGYMSGTVLSASSTFDGTIASLGLKPGTYVYTWGSSPSLPSEDGSLTVVITGTTGTIPEPATWTMMLLGFAGLGFAGYRAARKSAARAA
jgi:hypothetical protein